jgi:hypothetical protein
MLLSSMPALSARGQNLSLAKRLQPTLLLAVVLFLSLHFFLGFSSLVRESATFDEPAHIAAGYAILAFREFSLLDQPKNIPCMWTALPLLTYPPFLLEMKQSGGQKKINALTVGKTLLDRDYSNTGKMLAQCRAMFLLAGIALALVVFVCSRSLFGNKGALLSLAAYALCPTILAHARLATTEIYVALFFTLSAILIPKAMERPRPWLLGLTSLVITCLLLSNASGILVLPLYFLLSAWWLFAAQNTGLHETGKRERTAKMARRALRPVFTACILTSLVVMLLWAFHGFRFDPRSPAMEHGTLEAPELTDNSPPSARLPERGLSGLAIAALRAAHQKHLLPHAFLSGIYRVVIMSGAGRPSFMNGEYTNGHWAYFPYSFLVKTSLGVLLLLFLAAEAAACSWRTIPWRAMAPGAMFFTVYTAASLLTKINIGHRHILPLYPFLLIFIGLLGSPYIRYKGFHKAAGWIAVALLAAESLLCWPHYLAFFNAAAGGPSQGYRRLVDSSLDWGQDLPALSRWLAEHQDGAPVYLSYFGNAEPSCHGIQAEKLVGFLPWPDADVKDPVPPASLLPGTYCVSATMLHQIYSPFFGKWTPGYEEQYQTLSKFMKKFERVYALSKETPGDLEQVYLAGGGKENLAGFVDMYNKARFARLCAWLRQGEPFASAGYSILIYKLDRAALEAALFGPPPREA